MTRGEQVLPTRMTGSLFCPIAGFEVECGEAEAHEAVRMTQREREVIANIARQFEPTNGRPRSATVAINRRLRLCFRVPGRTGVEGVCLSNFE